MRKMLKRPEKKRQKAKKKKEKKRCLEGPQAGDARKLMEKSPLLLLGSDQSLPRQFGCNICGEENQRYSRRKKVLVLAKLECCHLSNKK
jgi:hypothetical protein